MPYKRAEIFEKLWFIINYRAVQRYRFLKSGTKIGLFPKLKNVFGKK